MSDCFQDLAEVLEQESTVGDELCRNLTAQKNALAAWDIDELLRQIEAREPWLRLLGDLEDRRRSILRFRESLGNGASLRQMIAELPAASPLIIRLAVLRERNQNIFARLQSEERDLQGVMKHLSGYIQEALQPLLQPAVPTYGVSGASDAQRPASALIKSQA
jgi:flagellar biosynthesis/type III secretory pathway chaperone